MKITSAVCVIGILALGALPILADAIDQCEDRDGDGYFAVAGCGTPVDCNDDDATIFPGADERCNGSDDDCDGEVDDRPECVRSCTSPEPWALPTLVSTEPEFGSRYPAVAWVGDGWVVAYETMLVQDCSKLSLRKLDPEGRPVGNPVVVSGGNGVNVETTLPSVVWTGSRLLVTWSEAITGSTCYGVENPFGVSLRLYSSDLVPLSDRVDLDPWCGTNIIPTATAIVWSGRVFGLAWGREDGPVGQQHFTTVDPSGRVENACGTVFSGPMYSTEASLSWDGQFFGVTWTEVVPETPNQGEIFFRRLTESRDSPDTMPIRVTTAARRSRAPEIAWADGEWGLSWSDERISRLAQPEIYFARLDPFGQKQDPPGDVRVTCCNNDQRGVSHDWSALAWTGREYGLFYVEETDNISGTGDLRFQRMSRTGETLGTFINVTPDMALNVWGVEASWNGVVFGAVYNDFHAFETARPQVYFNRVGCVCADMDHDGFSTCYGNDCDDTDPLVNVKANEGCTDGKDNDCDGMTDCQDRTRCAASAGSAPPEVSDVSFEPDKEWLTWAPAAGATSYDVLTGGTSFLLLDRDYRRATCLAWRVPTTRQTVAELPGTGDASYFLVRAKRDTCLLGSWGSRLRDAALFTCP